jgi:ubiquinone/menaquinone biosynthesis C-methylase UbiE
MTQRMYTDLSRYWHLLSPPEEYDEEAALYRETILAFAPQPPRTLLELGSGGGNNAAHLKQSFEMTLVDLSEGMLEQSRKLHPDLTHYLGDMRDVRLGRSSMRYSSMTRFRT